MDIHELVNANDMNGVRKSINSVRSNLLTIDQEGRSPLHIACELNQVDMVRLLCEMGADANQLSMSAEYPAQPPCMFAVWNGMNAQTLKTLKVLAAYGADLSWSDGDENLLHEACRMANLDGIRFLASTHGLNVDTQNRSGQTCLHLAILLADAKDAEYVTKCLLELGASTKIPDKTGRLPIQYILDPSGRYKKLFALLESRR